MPTWKCAKCHATIDPDRRDDKQCPKCGHADEQKSKRHHLYKWWECTRRNAHAAVREVCVYIYVPRTYKAHAFIQIDALGDGEGVQIDVWDEAEELPRKKYGLVVPEGCTGVRVYLEDEKLTYLYQTPVWKGQEKPKIVPLGKKCLFAKCDGGTWENGPPTFSITTKCENCDGTGELRRILLSVKLGIGAKVTLL